MPVLNGMDAAKKMRSKNSDVVMVFITNLSHYAIEGYVVGALDYVLKPINYSAFTLRLARAIQKINKKGNKDILLTSMVGITRVNT